MKNKSRTLSIYVVVLFSIVVTMTIAGATFVWIKGITNITLIVLLVSTLLSYTLFLMVYFLWRRKTYIATNNIVPSMPETIQVSERILKRGTINYDVDGTIVYISRWLLESGFKNFLGKEIESIGLNMHKKDIQVQQIDDRIFQFVFYHKTKIIIVLEITEQEQLKDYIKSKQPVVITIEKSFSPHLKNEEIELLKANIKINEVVEKWFESTGAIASLGQTFNQPILIIGTWFSIKYELIDEKLVNKIEEELGSSASEVSIAIGAASGSDTFAKLLEQSNQAVKLAVNRGGNQTVITDSDGYNQYIGASKVEKQSDQKSEIMLFAEKFLSQIKSHKEIFITTHINADIDAYASSLAMARLLNNLNLTTYIVLNDMDPYTKVIHNKLNKEQKAWFILENEAITKKTKRSAAIVLDVSTLERTQAINLINDIDNDSTYVIDHHRISSKIEYAEDEKIFVDTAASSTTTLLTEFIYGLNQSEILDEYLATNLLTGIYLDTNYLTRNTSARTYEIISALIKDGADNVKSSLSLKSSIDDIPLVTSALNNSFKVGRRTLLSVIPENKVLEDIDVSSLADMLLEYKGVDAGFVLARIQGNKYKLSARSNDKINVQLIAESLKGGGHFNSAAAVWSSKDNDYSKIEGQIKRVINKQLK